MPPAERGWLLPLCCARALQTSPFMTFAASLPVLRQEWDMSATAAGSVSTGFQLGYAVSLVVFSSLADRVGARRVFLVSGWLTAAAALVFAAFARSYLSGLVLYTLVALVSGGTYTPAIMLLADRYAPERRGSAVGWLIASSALGYALSLGLTGFALRQGGYRLAFLVTALGPLVGTALAALVLRGTPNVIHPKTEGGRFGVEVLRNREAVRLVLGYTAHSWELLGMWAWTPAFLAASFAVAGSRGGRAVEMGAFTSAGFHLMGLVASFTMGRLSDRVGRRSVLLATAAGSAICSLSFGWLLPAPPAVVLGVGALYGFLALGDSPVLSTALTEAVRPAYLGSALAVRSFLGFAAGAVAPLVFGAILDATRATWGWGFVALGAGGMVATACAFTLRRRDGQRPRER